MLRLTELQRQIEVMVRGERQRQETLALRLSRARKELRGRSSDWKDLRAKTERSRTSWLLAGPAGPLASVFPAPSRQRELTVVATDGSQIFPDRHAVSSCYLINIGRVAIHYGSGERPLMDSVPLLFYRQEDLYESWGGRSVVVDREAVAARRNLLEIEALRDLALRFGAEGRTVVALVDGSLILWPLEGKPSDFRSFYLRRFLSSMDELHRARLPVASYISSPRSADVINALRVGLCPEESPDCDHCPYRPLPQPLPCSPVEEVTDQMLFSRLLGKGERSQVFLSSSQILGEYGPHRVAFFYLGAGLEVARVEVPLWVAEDRELLDLVHAVVADQVEKGGGYPVTLSEAHEQAVVRGEERELFYRILRDTLVRGGLQVHTSRKSSRKRAAPV